MLTSGPMNDDLGAVGGALTRSPLHIEIGSSDDALATSLKKEDEEDNWPPIYTRIIACIASLNSCNIGYDIGVNSGLVYSFQRDGDDIVYLSDVQLEIYIGALAFTSIFGGLLMYKISNPYGRRGVFFLSQLFLLVGLTITICSNNYGVMIFGRLISGFAIGLGFTVDGLYIAEISPKKHRGLLVSWSETALNIGILLGFCSSYALKSVPGDGQWRSMIGLGMIMPCTLIVLIKYVLPESPRWLIMNGRKDEAGIILKKCTYSGASATELVNELKNDIDQELAASAGVSWSSLFEDPLNRKKLTAGLGIAVASALTGVEGIQNYMLHIFEDSGIDEDDEQFQALILVGIVKVLVISVGGYSFDIFGRRPTLIASNLCLSASLFIMAGTHNAGVGLFAVIFYVSAFSLGMGPGTWLVTSEMYSNDIRTKAVSITTFVNRSISVIVVSSWLSLASGMGLGIYVLFGLFTLGNAIFIYFYLPESKGKSLEQMQEVFKNF